MSVLSFEEFQKLRNSGMSVTDIVQKKSAEPDTDDYVSSPSGRSSAGVLSPEEFMSEWNDGMSTTEIVKRAKTQTLQEDKEDLYALARETASAQSEKDLPWWKSALSKIKNTFTGTGETYKADDMGFADVVTDRLLGVDRTQVTGEKTDWGELAKGVVRKGANQWNAMNWETVNMLLGGLAQKYHDTDFAKDIRALGLETANGFVDALNYLPGVNLDYAQEHDTNLITRMYQQATAGRDNMNKLYEANANSSRAAQIADVFGTSAIAAVPMAVEAWLLAPAQAAQAGVATTQGLSYFSGLQAAKGTEAAGMMLRQGLSKLVKNPQFWTSYLQVAGDGYEDALADGMSETDAKVYGLVNGFFNAMIEIGGADETLGGIQNLPMRLEQTGGKHAIIEWFKDAVLGEGKEEVLQGMFERGTKSFFGQDVPVYSLDPNDDKAILNPFTAGQEFTGGAVVGALLGGGQTAAEKIVRGSANAAAKAIDTRANQSMQQEEVQQTGEQLIRQTVDNMGVSEAEKQILVDGFSTGDADAQAYANGIREAFQYGTLGVPIEQALESASFADRLNETQFRHAWQIGMNKSGHQTESEQKAADTRLPAINQPEYASIEEFSREFSDPEIARNIYDMAPDTDVNQFAEGYNAAYGMGKSGVSTSYLTDANVPGLTEEQRTAAYQAGQEALKARTAKEAGEIAAQQKTGNLHRAKGTVKGEGVSIADLKKAFNDRQNVAYHLLTRYAEATGVNIVLYNSQPDPKTGLFPESQGRFQWKDNTIYIDINAGLYSGKDVNSLGKYTMLRTFAHEFTHFIEKWNPQQYNEFRTFVFQTMESRGQNVHDAIEEMMLRYNGDIDYEEASCEVIAEAMADILPDSTLVKQLAEEHPNVFRTLLKKLREFVARMKQYYNGIQWHVAEAEMLKENGVYLDGIVRQWDQIAKKAVENYQGTASEKLADQPQKTESKAAEPQTKRAGMDFFKQVEVSEEEAPKLRSMVQQKPQEPETRRIGRDYFPANDLTSREEAAPDLKGMVQRVEEKPELQRVARDRFPANDFTSQAEEAPDLKARATQIRPVSRDRFPANDLTSREEAGPDLKSMVPQKQEEAASSEPAREDTPEGAKLRGLLDIQNSADLNGFHYEIMGMRSKTVDLQNGGTYSGAEYRASIQHIIDGIVTVFEGRSLYSETFPTREQAVDALVAVAENNHLLEEREEKTDGQSDGTAAERKAGNDNARMAEGSEDVRGGESGRAATEGSSELKEAERDLQKRSDSGEGNVPAAARPDRAAKADRNGRNDRNGDGNGLQRGSNVNRPRRKNGRADSGVQETVPIKPRGKQNINNYHIEEDIDSIRPNFQDNYNAIKLVKQLLSENRPATEEERAVLAKYKGWGGLKEYVLNPNSYYGRQLQQLLTPEEYETARDSVLNAHYTSTKVIDGIYRAVQRMGFKGGNVLEPSMGVGNFFGMLPKSLSPKSSLYGVELDKITGTIAKNLYPDAKIDVAGFQDVLYGDDTFDLVVGNVPFSNDIKIPYRGGKYNLHDFFFIKALDETRPGGIVALISSTGTLDKLSGKTQTAIADRANMVAAFRLPDNAFRANAGTSVTTDLIFLQKKGPGVPDNGVRFTEIGKINDVPINEYYVEHPENILGELAYEKGMYAAERTVVHATPDFEQRFNKAMDSLPKNIMNVNPDASAEVSVKKRGEKKHTTFAVTDKGAVLVDAEGKKTELTPKQTELVKKYTEVKEQYFKTSEAEQNGNIEAANELRAKLNKSYDAFVKKYGTLEKNKRLLGKDDEFLRVSGLEIVDKEGNVSKSAIFERPTLYREKKASASTSSEGLSIALNETGRVDVDMIAELTGKTTDEVVADLADEIIFTPDGNYELIPVYLSGNIYQKLDAVEGRKGFERQAELLKTAIPKPKTTQEIDAEISSHWIPPKYINEFIKDQFQIYGRAEAKYIKEVGKWDIEKFWSPIKKWSTDRVSAYDLLLNTLNNKKIVVTDKKADGSSVVNVADTKIAQNKQNDLRSAFREWIFKDAERSADLVDIFNRTLNAYAPLNFEALADKIDFGIDPSSPIKLRDYQKAAVARIVFGGNTLLHHGVGTGKTATMITAAHVLKSTGISQKPMFVVPNGKVLDFKREILNMYPGARILALDADLLNPKELKRTKALIATNDWDYVLIHRTGFQKIGVSPETTAAFVEQQLEELETAIRESGADEKRGTRFEKSLITKKKNLEEKLKKILESPKDDSTSFETMGIDALFVDEAHNFKKVGFATTQSISGVDSSTNVITTDLYMKENWLRERGGRIVLATATPITNTVSEMYNMTLHVDPDILREAGVYAFDGWLNTFGDLRSDMEIASDGKTFRMKERIQDFKNGNELISLYRQFADVKQTKDVVKGLPEAEEVTVVCKGSDFHQTLLDTFAARMDSVGRGSKDDNALNVNNDAKAAATDLRMVSFLIEELFPGTPTEYLDLPDSKINKAVENIVDEYKKSKKNKGTQLVFLDSGMGRGKTTRYTFNLYGDLISKLVKSGVPREEIADIGDYSGDDAKQKLYDMVNDGTIRVLIGSTAKMGEGVNVQNKIVALHHLSVPMRADNLEQRNGRAIRHGNENDHVRIYKYIQEQSYDSYLWQMIERKSRYMAQALNGGDASDLEEISEVTVNAQQSKAIATGNPAIMEKFKLEDEISTLRTLESAYNYETREAARTAAKSKAQIEEYENIVDSLEQVDKVLEKNRKDTFELTVGNQTFDKRADAAPEFFRAYIKDGTGEIGSIYGMTITKHTRPNGDKVDKGIIFNGNPDTFVEMGDSPEGNITRLMNGLDRIKEAIKYYNNRIDNLEKTVADAEKTAARKEFPKAKELNDKLARLEEINEELGIKTDTVEINVTSAEEDDEGRVQESRRATPDEEDAEQNDAGGIGEGRVQYSRRVTNPETLKHLNEQLEKGEVVHTYKTFLELEVNGEKKLYPPMASKQYDESGKLKMANAMAVGEWEESVGNPNSKNIVKVVDKDGNVSWDYKLKKEGGGEVQAAYDPYQHSSNVVLNDQFEAAYKRPNLVTYECVVTLDDLNSGYHYREARADGDIVEAALPVGEHDWKKGIVAGNLKNTDRKVYMTRYLMPVRRMDNAEVAQMYKDILDKEATGISVPFNVVPPGLQAELEKAGVPIDYEGSPMYQSLRSRFGTEKFPAGKPIVQNSIRRETLSNREVLERAAKGIDTESLSDAEKNALNIFNGVLTKLKDEQDKRYELGRQYKDQQFTKGGSRADADKIRAAMSVSDAKIKSLENRLLSLENKDMLKRVLQKARKVVEVEERERGEEKLKRYRERRNEGDAVRKYRDRVKAEVDKLREWMMKPSNKDVRAHVPAEIQKSVVDFIDSISLMSKTALRTGGLETTKADEKYLKNMKRLRDAIKANVNSKGLYSGYNDLPENFIEMFDAMIGSTENYINANSGTFVVNAMSAAELKDLYETLKTLRKYITTMNRFHNNAMFQHAYDAGEETIGHLSQFDRSKKSGRIYNFLRFGYMRPSYAFEHFGKGGQSIEHEFREGQSVQAFLAKKIIEFAKKTYTGKEVKAWSEETKTFTTTDGEKVSMPITHLMSLYCLNKRPQALTHIFGDGIRVANYKDGKHLQLDEGHIVTINDVQQMIQSLTPRQKEVADAIQKYMSTETSAWGNYVSMARFDVEQFTEPNYFPINSDGRYLSTTADESPDNAGLYALLNSSFTKELKENADNRIILYNIFDVFANHTASMAQYRAFALPVLDALKWFNYKNDNTSVRTKLSSAFGAPLDERAGSGAKGYAEQFVINLLKAYNGTSAQGDPYDTTALKFLHRFNGAAIAFNLRVVIQQPTAITRAAMLLSPAKLMKGLGMSVAQMRKLAAEMEAHSGIAAWKSLGFYDTNISRGLTDLIKQNPTALDNLMEIGTAGAEWADRFTWAAMWYAAKETVNRSNYATEAEYFNAVTKLFEDVIYKTQVVDSLLTKAEFLRAKGFAARQAGSFMSEPSATFSMLADAYYRYTDDLQRGLGRSEAWKRNGGNIVKTAAVYAIGQVVLSAMQAVMDAWRDQDDEDPDNWLHNYIQKYLKAFKGNVIEEELIFGKIPWVSEAWESIKGLLDYAKVFETLGIDMYGNDVSSGFAMYFKYVKKTAEIIIDKLGLSGNKTNYTTYGIVYNLLRAVANTTGLPVATAWREVQDIWNNTVGYYVPNMKLKTYERAADRKKREGYELVKGTGLTQQLYYEIFTAADADNDGIEQAEIGPILLQKLKTGEITPEQAEAVWNVQGWKTDFNKWSGKNGGGTTPGASSEKTASTAAAKTAAPQGYDDFSKAVPLYTKETKLATYSVWQNSLKGTMTLDRFIDLLNKANTDGNDNLKQDELGAALRSAVIQKEMTQEQAEAVWDAQGWKHNYTWWLNKNW